MEQHKHRHKRPRGWSKPYWAWAGLYVCVTLSSFVASLILVGFVCGILLRAAIPAEPIVWRTVETVLDAVIYVVAAWYFASQEGYAKRTAQTKACVVGGTWFLLLQCPVALLLSGAPYAAGPFASRLAQLLYFGNESLYASSLEPTPPLWVVGCTVVGNLCLLIPAMAVFDRLGAQTYQKEQAKLIAENTPQE